MSTSFIDLGVSARMAEALTAAGITEAFPVQAITLPDALAGRDLCGRAPTGSGKTLGFGIPLMMRVSQAEPTRPTGLVLVPTRELADQVQRAFVPLGRAAWRFVQAVYGGSPMAAQIHSLRKGASVVVATPGRLLDLIEQGHCDLSKVEVLVIDEADRMADLGFMPDVRKILDMTPDTRQTMLWSATLDGDVNELVNDYLKNPARHDLVGEVAQGDVEHRFVVTAAMDRVDATVDLMSEGLPTVIFVKTRFGVDDVTAALMNAGIKAGSLHGARTQQARQRTLDDFKRGKVQALVATDVAARGIHVDDVDLVVHYDLPDNDKDYLHRSGRTGRAGRDGKVVAFVPPSRVRVAKRLIDTLEVEVVWDAGATPAERVDRGPRPARPSYEERVARAASGGRGGDRPSFRDRNGSGDRPERSDRPAAERSSWGDRNERPSSNGYQGNGYQGTGYQGRNERPAAAGYQGRNERPASNGYQGRSDRPAAAGYQGHSERPAAGYQGRSDRSASPARPGGYQGRTDRPSGDRPAWGDRNDRSASTGYQGRNDRSASPARPAWGDRNERPGYQGRSDRSASPARPGGYQGRSDRSAAPARPAWGDRNERPAGGRIRNDNAGYQGRTERPSGPRPNGYQGRNERPAGDRPAYGAARGNARPQGDRPAYQGRSERPGGIDDGASTRPAGRPGPAGSFRRPTGR